MRCIVPAKTLPGLFPVVCVLLWGSCDPPRPPVGQRLRLRGAKGAFCSYDRECASGTCLGKRCTEKIEKVGLGGECTSDDYCKKGFHCDTAAKKCAPNLACEKFSSKLRACALDVYIAFRPKEGRKLRRMKPRQRRRFLNRVHRILYKGLCGLTRSGASFKRSMALQRALKQKSCAKFAAYYYKGARKSG